MKKLFTNLIAILMLVVVLASCMACEDIKTLKITVDVYQGLETTTPKSYEVKFDLYRHLAPETVDGVQSLVKNGYYENTIFYKYANENTEQVMLGDYVYDANATGDVKFKDNTKTKSYIKGEFEKAGVKGTDLVHEKYSIGLWRLYDVNLANYGGSVAKLDGVDSVYNSGSSSLFMPTSTLSGYNGYFTVFGKITDDDSKENFDKIVTALNDGTYYATYTVFWTGDKDNLTKHIMLTQRYEDGVADGSIKDVFDPNDESVTKSVKQDYYMYKPFNINVLQENRRVVVSKIEL